MNIIKFLCGKWWGADPETLLTLYKSYVKSALDYGCYIDYPKTIKLCEKLESIQNSAIRIALGYRKSTPKNILLAETRLTTIKERVKQLCCTYLVKIHAN